MTASGALSRTIRWGFAAGVLLTAVAFFLIAWGGIELSHTAQRIAPLWLANGMVVAVVLTQPWVRARWYLLACFIANIGLGAATGDDLLVTTGFAFANQVEIAIVYFALRRIAGPAPDLTDFRTLGWFALIGGIVAPFAAATLASFALVPPTWAAYQIAWFNWAMADGLGMLIAAPLLLILKQAWVPPRLWTFEQMADWAALMVAGGGGTILIFSQNSFPFMFMPAFFVLIAAFRLGVIGAAVSAVSVAVIASVATAVDSGPLHLISGETRDKILILQIFLLFLFAGALPVAAALAIRLKLQAQLEQSRDFARSILDNMREVVFHADDHAHLTFLNPAWEDLTGLRIADCLGKHYSEIIGAEGLASAVAVSNALTSGKSDEGSLRASVTHADGSIRHVEVSVRALRGPGGEFLGTTGNARDITDQLAAREALMASEERHRSLYNKTPIMLHSTDVDGRLVSVSDYWLSHLGYRREDVIGRKVIELLMPAEDRDAAEEGRQALLVAGGCHEVERRVVTASGETRDVLVSAVTEYDENGAVSQSMAVMTDVTERKAVERQLIQAQKMESVGQLTGGLAHDFNNLLAVVMGNLQLIEHAGDHDPRTGRRITAALDAAERGAALTSRLLAFARRQQLESETVEPNPLIEELGSILRRTLGENIALDCRLAEGLPCIRTDRAQLESALLNLALNSRDAMPNGGKLTIASGFAAAGRVHDLQDSDGAAGDYVVIAVSDTGGGIPADKIEKVFEPFFTTKEFGKGSGLGLSMVYGFIKQSGGHVRIQSEPGRGTTVRLFLPVADDDGARAEPRPGPAPGPAIGGSETVLVVEDQEGVRHIATAMLEDLGYTVLAAASGMEALDVLRDPGQRVDLLFTDMVMPGEMNGAELAQCVRTLRPGLPIVFTTGYAEASILHRGEASAAANLVTKPYRREELAAKLRQALDGAAPGMRAAAAG